MKKELIIVAGIVGGCYCLAQMVEISVEIGFLAGASAAKKILDDVAKERQQKISYWHMYAPVSKQTHKKKNRISVESGFKNLELPFKTREEATAILDFFEEIVRNYGKITVADLKSLVGESSEYTDEAYGWTDSVGVHIEWRPETYCLVIPPAKELEANIDKMEQKEE